MFRVDSQFTAPLAKDQLGRERKSVTIPAGTILIPNRQPLAHLVAAMLEFDPRLPPEVLRREREELLRGGASRVYDTTAWNLTMMHGLPALTLAMDVPSAAQPYRPPDDASLKEDAGGESIVAYVIDGGDDLSVTAAARLMQRGLEVRIADKRFEFDKRQFARGSVVVTRVDNRRRAGNWQQTLHTVAGELKLAAVAVKSGQGNGQLPDLGGRHFRRLQPPRIALLGRGGTSPYDFGALWHLLDHRLGVRHSRLNETASPDLQRYNVLIVPDPASAPRHRSCPPCGESLLRTFEDNVARNIARISCYTRGKKSATACFGRYG